MAGSENDQYPPLPDGVSEQEFRDTGRAMLDGMTTVIVEESMTATGRLYSVRAWDSETLTGVEIPEGYVIKNHNPKNGDPDLIDNWNDDIKWLTFRYKGEGKQSGCKTLKAYSFYEDLGGVDGYHWVNESNWCWKQTWKKVNGKNVPLVRKVTDFSQSTSIVNLGTFWYWRGLVPHANLETHYSWRAGFAESGFKTFKQAKLEFCVFRIGCIYNAYPQVRSFLHSNGTWTVRSYSPND